MIELCSWGELAVAQEWRHWISFLLCYVSKSPWEFEKKHYFCLLVIVVHILNYLDPEMKNERSAKH